MKEIKIIKLVSFLLFIIPLFTLLLILSVTNHLVSYSSAEFPYGLQKEQIIICNESNNFCEKRTFKKIKLTECSLNKYKIYLEKDGVVLDNYQLSDLKRKNSNFSYEIKIVLTEEIDNQCIKLSKIFFLYKLFPELESLYNYLNFKIDFAISESINPFIKGEASISNIVKRYPFNYIFKPLMYIVSILMCGYWINYYIFFKKNNFYENNKYLIFGIISSVLLFLHVLFLGADYEIPYFQKIRRLIIASFIFIEIFAEFLLAIKIYKLRFDLLNQMRKKVIFAKMIFVWALIMITVISLVYMILFDPGSAFNNILEWNYFCFLLFFYLLSSVIWKSKN